MAFLDQVGQKLTKTSQEAMKKTKDMTEVVRLNNAITEEQKRIDSHYLEIGRLYYHNFADRKEEVFRSHVAQIRQSEASMSEMKATIRRLKGLVACPMCGNEQQTDAVFCNSCGAKMPQRQEEVVQPQGGDGIKCKSCGKIMQKGMAFCMNCGAKLEEEEPTV